MIYCNFVIDNSCNNNHYVPRLFGEVEEAQKDMDFFLEGQAVITAIAAILFGIVSIRAVAVGRGYEEYHQQDDL